MHGLALSPYWITFTLCVAWTLASGLFSYIKSRWEHETVNGFKLFVRPNRYFQALNVMYVLTMSVYGIVQSDENSNAWQNYEEGGLRAIESGSIMLVVQLVYKMCLWESIEKCSGTLEENLNEDVDDLTYVRAQWKRWKLYAWPQYLVFIWSILMACWIASHIFFTTLLYFYLACIHVLTGISIIHNESRGWKFMFSGSCRHILLSFVVTVCGFYVSGLVFQTAYHYSVLLYSGENVLEIIVVEFSMRDSECYIDALATSWKQKILFLSEL